MALGSYAVQAADVKPANHRPLSPGYVPIPGVISLIYDVEAIGIPAVTARFDLTFAPDSYDMAVLLRTIGVIDWMADWNMNMAARGALTNIASSRRAIVKFSARVGSRSTMQRARSCPPP